MEKREQITSFYVETLVLITVFIAVILVLTRVFGLAARESAGAAQRTAAVRLAENAAEMVSASRDAAQLQELLDRGSGCVRLTPEGVTGRYGRDLLPDAEGAYEVSVTWEEDGAGLVNSRITVLYGGETPLYTLETAVYTGEVTP